MREILKQKFLKETNLNIENIEEIKSDASFRCYSRLFCGDVNYILMDAPPEKENAAQFVEIAEYLQRFEIKTPKIFQKNVRQGFVLLEDLGDESIARYLQVQPQDEFKLYKKAIDLLIKLQQIPVYNKCKEYDFALLYKESRSFLNWFYPFIFSKEAGADVELQFIYALEDSLKDNNNFDKVFIHRDYMSENLMYDSENENLKLIDFQDSLTGSPAYDFVSLIECARRDLVKTSASELLEYYLFNSNYNIPKFLASYYALGAQRNLKILGYFARKKMRDDDPRYLKYLKRVWGYLVNDLKHPVNQKLKIWFINSFGKNFEINIANELESYAK